MTGPAGGEFSLFSDVDASGQAEAAERYLRAAADRAGETRRVGYELLGVTEGWSVLDVGCGLGEVCADLAELVGSSGRVVGVDVSAEMIARARERWSHLAAEFDVGDGEALVFEDETFDAVRAERVIQHLVNPARAIAEMARVTRRGGRVFVLDPVHDATIIATDYPDVWETIRAHGPGAVRQPRAGLFLKEWMHAADLEVELTTVGRVIEDWPACRTLQRVDDAAALAVNDGAIGAAQVDDFFAEQQRRFEQGVFTQSIFFVHALGTKPQ
jgi:SAM-dependent methyltransferase